MPLAATLIAPQKIELRKREALQPESREVVIAVEHAGVCGTDLALFSGVYSVPLPLVCGHEFVGVDRAAVGQTSKGVDSRVHQPMAGLVIHLHN